MQTLRNIFWLGTKELRSFFRDWVLLGLVVYSFSLAIIAQAQSNSQELHNASIAIVDEDHSELSARLAHAFLPPYFLPAVLVAEKDIDHLMNVGAFTFVLDIPPNFERDLVAGRKPTLQLNVDATAMVQAGIGSGYAQEFFPRLCILCHMLSLSGYYCIAYRRPEYCKRDSLQSSMQAQLNRHSFSSIPWHLRRLI